MAYPPPPGLKQTPSSLPPRPPPSSNAGQPPAAGGRPGYNAFTAFQPRAVASHQPRAKPVISAPPVPATTYAAPATTYAAPATSYGHYQQAPQAYSAGPSYYNQPQYTENTYGPTISHIQNPFGSTPQSHGNGSGLDAETEAQIAQWQSAYATPAEDIHKRHAGTGSSAAGTPTVGATPQPESQQTVVRSGGGQTWNDSTLLEWDPAHFRLFVGNLAGEVTDESLLKAFSRYTSVQKARVIREKRTQKSKGFGFISFSNGDDYFAAGREMQGKYIGSHPILLRRSNTEVRPEVPGKKGKKNGGGKNTGNTGSGSKVKKDGVKKPGKTKGGLKILG
ncbi:unnamed protein product [Penicillium olsonii]|nr:unnamed protein product [Penicillium olsonii]CAG7930510.1 unnamed protein product [Penicillium olsonii]